MGRKRKAGDRYPSGRLRFEADPGSPQLLVHRLQAVVPSVAWPEDADLESIARRRQGQDKRSAYPLGILLLRGEITSSEHYAGCRYMALFVRAVRGIGVPSILADLAGRGSVTSFRVFSETVAPKAAETRREYLRARQALEDRGRYGNHHVAAVVDRWAVFEEGLPPMAMRQLLALRCGLGVLADHFNVERDLA
jgi:hypothetical protein